LIVKRYILLQVWTTVINTEMKYVALDKEADILYELNNLNIQPSMLLLHDQC